MKIGVDIGGSHLAMAIVEEGKLIKETGIEYTSKGDMTEVVKRVKVILRNYNNEILLGYSNNEYQFVGGHVEKNETDSYFKCPRDYPASRFAGFLYRHTRRQNCRAC